ncbi:hypothetical protein PS623_04783 [Pseudomonas fluorescens]|uniref:DUF1656 domain-containing protein n=1 Tax=Pseudomonas fluorescens TaxID=294 RepID=UPI001242443D|nr:DUF1656 domain-containing protein [Pseudomonas fluorescens]VVN31133.1 hypothetical protein PS623_04783 [Pseudomonas fluorescens]
MVSRGQIIGRGPAVLVALLLTGLLRLVLRVTPLGRWIWHEALFDVALFSCIVSLVVHLLGRL